MQATCGGCAFRARSGVLTESEILREARVHDGGGHRVTVWDSHTSQMPRNIWYRENDRNGVPLTNNEAELLQEGRRARAVAAVAARHEVRSSGWCTCGENLNGHRLGIHAPTVHLAESLRSAALQS